MPARLYRTVMNTGEDYYKHRAEIAKQRLGKIDDAAVVQRRIERLEADLRATRMQESDAQATVAVLRLHPEYAGERERLDRQIIGLVERETDLNEQLDHWRRKERLLRSRT